MNRFIFTLTLFLGTCIAGFAKSGTFKIQGDIDPSIAESCQMVAITELDASPSSNPPFTAIVKDDRFYYETTLDGPRVGRIRGLDKNGKLSSSWIDLTFIPDFTLRITMRNGSYTIANIDDYNRRVNKYLEDDKSSAEGIRLNNATLVDAYGCPVATRKITTVYVNGTKVVTDPDKGTYIPGNTPEALENLGQINSSDIPAGMKEALIKQKLAKVVLDTKMDGYKEMLVYLKSLRDNTSIFAERQDIIKQIEAIMKKMDAAIDEYAKALK